MVSDSTRSRRAKNDEVSDSKGEPNSDKGGPGALSSAASESATGLRRSSREAFVKKGSAVSPTSIRKSERIGPSRSPRKPEEGGSGKRSASPSPLRRSNRGKARSASGDSSGSKKSDKSSNPLLAESRKVQKEKTVMQLNLETKEVGSGGKVGVKPVKAGKKRGKKWMSSPAYMALFDRNKKQERENKSSHGDSNNSRGEFDGLDQSSARGAAASVDKNARKSSKENLVVNELEKKVDGQKEVLSTSRRPNSMVIIKNVEPEIVVIDCSENEKDKRADQVDCLTQGGTSEDPIGFKNDQETNLLKRKRFVLDTDSDSSVDVSKRVCTSNAEATAPLLASEGITGGPVEKSDLFSQRPRVEPDSTMEGHYSHNANLNLELATPSLNKGRWELKAGSTVGLAEKHNNLVQRKGPPRSLMPASEQYICFTCKLGGKIFCCEGRGCKRSYHLSCLDPPLDEDRLGVWYCLACVKKKLESGVHSVSEGVESIWDAKELEVIDVDGLLKKREYFVKYKGLAHIHNRWIPESELLLDAPSLLAKFNKKSQFSSWNQEWTFPRRLLQKRLLMSPKHGELYLTRHVGEKLDCRYEWLVKWVGLDYEHVTWELDNDAFFKSPDGLRLIKDYENRHKRMNGASSSKVDKMPERESGKLDTISQLQSGTSSRASSNVKDFIDKLHEFWREDRTAVVIEDQANERFVKMICLVLSFQPNNCQPFLIISTSATLHLWDVEFLKCAPHLNAVVYNGDKDLRKIVRKLEFYNEGGFIMFQVLFTTLEIVLEDLDILRNIKWKSIIIDEPQRTRMSSHCSEIKLLDAERRLLLLSFQLKENVAEYHNLLRLLESLKDSPNSNSLLLSDDVVNPKEKFSSYIAYGCMPDSSRFREYWVPIQVANLQLEQYCATLISNSAILFGTHKSNCAGTLRDVVISSRKCCDHPYTVDKEAPARLSEGLPVSEYLEFGVNASGKFQFLDMMLSKLKNQGLRALILFQELGKDGVGDILEDFIQQRFGKETYERIVVGIQPAKRNAALNNFNKDCSRFVFLIETRACLSSIKLSSVNTIIILGSDWNPMNDMRALQRVTLDPPPSEQIPVFRLYLSHTLEEKILSLAKQEKFLDSHILNMGWNTSHVLLMWGASHQFQSLEEFHHGAATNSCSNTLSNNSSLELTVKKKNKSSLKHVVQEVLQIISSNSEDTKSWNSSIVCGVQKVGGGYHTESSLPGELESQVMDENQPNIFWTKLLEGKHPQWKFISGSTRRNRKKVQYSENEAVTEEVVKKRRRTVNGVDLPSLGFGSTGTSPRRREGAFGTESLCRSPLPRNESTRANCAGTSPFINNILVVPLRNNFETEKRRKLCEAQKSLHLSLKPGILQLCNILKLTGDSEDLVKAFLEYMMSYHNVNSNSPTTMQAFQISLIWTVASMLLLKIDHKQSVALARQHLKFNCRKEEAEFAYSMLRCFKTIFSYRTGKLKTDSLSSLALSRCARDDVRICVNQIKKKCEKKLQKLIRKQKEEKERIMRNYEEKKLQIQNRFKMNTMVIRTCFESNSSMKLVNLKQAEISSAKELEVIGNERNISLKNLESRQLALRTGIQEKEAHWLDAVKSWVLPELFGEAVKNVSFNLLEILQNDEEVMAAEDISNNGVDNDVSVTPPSSEEQIHNSLTMDAPEKRVLQEGPEMICSSDRVEGVSSRDEPSARYQDLNTSMAVDVMPLNNLEKEVQMEAQEIEQNLVSADGLSSENRNPDTSTVVVAVNEVQLRVPEAVNANDGAVNDGSGSRLPSEEHLDTTTINLPDKEIPSSVPQPSHQEVEGAHSSEENNDICTGASNGSIDINQQDSPNNAVNQSLPQELSQVNSSCLQMQPTTAMNDDNPVPPNQTHQIEGTVPSASDGMQLEDTQTGDQQSASVSVEHPVSQPLDASPQNQSVHETTVSEPEAQEHMSPSTNPLPSAKSAGVPLGEDIQHLPTSENHAPGRVSQSPVNQSVNEATVSEHAAQVHVLASPNPLPSYNSVVVPGRAEILHLASSENQSVREATVSEPAVQEHLSPSSNPLHGDYSAGVALTEEIQHLSSIENHASNQVSQSPVELSVNAPLVSNQPVLQVLPGSSLPLNGLLVGPPGMHFSGTRTMTVASEFNNLPAQPVHASITLMTAPPCLDPLQKELERLSNDFEAARKRHEDRRQELKSERDKEIEEALAKINQKYELKQQEFEAEFLSQKNEYDERQSKVLLNKCLADAFRTKCTEIKMTSRSGAQPDVNGNLVQQMVHLPMQQNALRRPLVGSSSANPPSARLQARPLELNPRTTAVSIAAVGARNTAPPAQAIAPPARPITASRNTAPPPPTTVPAAVPLTASRNTPPALQTVRPSAVSPAPAARPPQIGSVSYSNVAPQGSAQMSTRPPHLRSSSSPVATGTPPHLRGISTPGALPPLPAPPRLPATAASQSRPADREPGPEASRELPNTATNLVSAVESQRSQASQALSVSFPSHSDWLTITDQLNVSASGTAGARGNRGATSGQVDVVYLSDDD